jgi:hypothetical protein
VTFALAGSPLEEAMWYAVHVARLAPFVFVVVSRNRLRLVRARLGANIDSAS